MSVEKMFEALQSAVEKLDAGVRELNGTILLSLGAKGKEESLPVSQTAKTAPAATKKAVAQKPAPQEVDTLDTVSEALADDDDMDFGTPDDNVPATPVDLDTFKAEIKTTLAKSNPQRKAQNMLDFGNYLPTIGVPSRSLNDIPEDKWAMVVKKARELVAKE